MPQPQAADQPLKPSAPPPRHFQRPQLVNGKSPQGSRATVQIEQHLLMRGASGIGMGTTIKHLRRTTSGASGNGLGATMKYLRRTTSAGANNCMSTTITPPCSAAPFEVNSEPHTGARPSVRLCVGPELARCVHIQMILFQNGKDIKKKIFIFLLWSFEVPISHCFLTYEWRRAEPPAGSHSKGHCPLGNYLPGLLPKIKDQFGVSGAR